MQLYPDGIGKRPNATGVVKCHVVEQSDVARRQRKLSNG